MPLRPSSHPYSRLRTIDQHHWQWRARNIGGLPGDGDRWSAIDGQPQDDGPENRQPFPSHRRAPMDDRSTSRMDGRETAAIAESSTSRGMERLFTPFPAVSQLLPVLQIHFRSHADTLFPYYTGFWDMLDCPGHFSKYFRFPNSTSGPTPETGNGMPTSLFY